MKATILLLVLTVGALADTIQGIHQNTLCSPENSINDGSGNARTLTNTLPITISAATFYEGAYSMTGFNVANVVKYPDPTVWASDISVTAQGYFYVTGLGAYQIFNWPNTILTQNNGVALRADGGLDFTTYSTVTKSAASVVAINTWYYLAMHWGADGNKLYLVANPKSTSNYSTALLSNSTINAYVPNGNGMQFCRYAPAGGADCTTCFIDSWRMSNGDIPTTLPTSDMHVPNGSTSRAMELNQGMRMGLCCGL